MMTDVLIAPTDEVDKWLQPKGFPVLINGGVVPEPSETTWKFRRLDLGGLIRTDENVGVTDVGVTDVGWPVLLEEEWATIGIEGVFAGGIDEERVCFMLVGCCDGGTGRGVSSGGRLLRTFFAYSENLQSDQKEIKGRFIT